MKAIVTKAFIGRRDNGTISETFSVGDEIEGELADSAVKQKNAELPRKKGAPKAVNLTKLDRAALEKLAAEQGVDISALEADADIIAALEAAGNS